MWLAGEWMRRGLSGSSPPASPEKTKEMSSSTLVETVSIPLEDFAESFLTCATCLCPYDEAQRRPKLLSCSHTVCGECLERIAQLSAAAAEGSSSESPAPEDPPPSGALRCPICREPVSLPAGGVSSLPPSFLVNQLIDLMQRQRKDLVAKCTAHPGEELLFCETCDQVFCPLCRDGEAEECHNHTILPLSVAVKRMSEILAYKAAQCRRNLEKASEAVEREMKELDENVDSVLEDVEKSFQDVFGLVEARRRAVTESLRKTREGKRRVLQDQLLLVQSEMAKVQAETQRLGHQVEVREITAKIGELNGKLDRTLTLMEPRENAFLRHDADSATALAAVQAALGAFGTLAVSRTFPALCTAEVPSSSTFATHTLSSVLLTTIDYHGQRRKDGGDPVTASLESSSDSSSVAVSVVDRKDGTYFLQFRAPRPGLYRLSVRIFNRPIKTHPLSVPVSPHHRAEWSFGPGDLRQPVKVCAAPDGLLYVLDTGLCRVLVLSPDGSLVRSLAGESLNSQSAVGLQLLPASSQGLLLTLNWRSKSVTEWDEEGREDRSFTFSEFLEPIDLAIDTSGRILVADNGAHKVFVFDADYRPLMSFPVGPKEAQSSPARFLSQLKSPSKSAAKTQLSCVAAGRNSDILVGTSGGVLVFSKDGELVRSVDIGAQSASVVVGGLAVEPREGLVLASLTDKGRTLISVADYEGRFRFAMDSAEAKLRRPCGLAVTRDGEGVLVADLGNRSVKRFRFK